MNRKYMDLLVALMVIVPCAIAQVDGIEGHVVVAGQAASEDGDVANFREIHEGAQEGLLLESLELVRPGETLWRIDSRFTTGEQGWLDMEAHRGAWSAVVSVTQTTAWSDTSFAFDFLPSGTPVHDLFPGTTGLLAPLFIDDPHTTSRRLEARVMRRFGDVASLGLAVGGRSRDGERVPNIGGISFSDIGTRAFYTAGLHDVDSSSSFVRVDGRYGRGPLALRAAAASESRENEFAFTLPAFGESALLDFNAWSHRHEVDTRWLRADGSWSRGAVSFFGGASWLDAKNDPRGGDRRVDATGEVLREGLALQQGDVDSTVTSAAIGVAWRPLPAISLTLAADMRDRSNDGSGNLLRRGSAFSPVVTSYDETRAGVTAEAAARFGPNRVRLRVRGFTAESDAAEARGAFEQDITREREVTEVRAELSRRLTGRVRARAWVELTNEEVDVVLRELIDGYATGDGERDRFSGAFDLTLGRGARRTLLSFTRSETDIDQQEPLLDPVFDPSLTIGPASASVVEQRIAASSGWSGARASAWVEAGWLERSWEFDDVDRPAGFALLDEEVRGLVAAIGGEIEAWRGGRLSGDLEWIDDSDDLDRNLLRARVELHQAIRRGLEVYARWRAGDLSSDIAPGDEYTVQLLAVGLRASF